MSISISYTYGKKVGLPAYSSHNFELSLVSEINDLEQLRQESERVYALLQQSVDRKIQESGYHPLIEVEQKPMTQQTVDIVSLNKRWICSDKQKKLICDLIAEHDIPDADVDELSCSMFGKNVFELTKFEASGLISELFNQHGKPKRGK